MGDTVSTEKNSKGDSTVPAKTENSEAAERAVSRRVRGGCSESGAPESSPQSFLVSFLGLMSLLSF